ncbi:MAG: LLM class flavin-dependent oxidoreductase [Gammaproteobacteria bacterium]|nr:LLM class flavin-dependent oxidoreductase [Gammaproteobacteria bacterium]
MHFDLFYELSVPPHSHKTESQVFADTLNEWQLADQLGFRAAWLVEHHFMRAYSHSSSPSLFLAAASQRTQRLRLGHGIVPLPYHHPIHVAEQLATLDVLSGGRVEFGYGRGFSPQEYQVFGADMANSRHLTQESLDIIRASFSGQAVNFRGEHFQFEQLDVLPKCVQQPHPPLWAAAVSPESFELAAQQQAAVLVGPFKPWFMVKEDIRRYRECWQQLHPDKPAHVGMTVGIFCLEDGKRARQLAKPALEWFYSHLLNQTRPILEKMYRSYEYYKSMETLHTLFTKVIHLRVLETLGMAIVGDPDHCIAKLRQLQQHGVTHVLCAIGAGALPSEQVQESMLVLASQVMPAFSPQS